MVNDYLHELYELPDKGKSEFFESDVDRETYYLELVENSVEVF